MKYLFFFTVSSLLGCAATLPRPLDTTKWAEAQDEMFSSALRPTLEKVNEFDVLFRAQEKITPTNLTLRQHILLCAARNDNFCPGVSHEFRSLYRNGYWVEGFSYWQYCEKGFSWYRKITGNNLVNPAVTARINFHYAKLLGPDFSIPLPEVRSSGSNSWWLDAYAKSQTDSTYTVIHWRHSFLIISKENNPNPKLNLHHHLDAGYFALAVGGHWAVRCSPYTGFDPKNLWSDGGLDTLLPAGALRPSWRLDPPEIDIFSTKKDSTNGCISFLWWYDHDLQTLVSRSILWDDSTVEVFDGTMVSKKWRVY